MFFSSYINCVYSLNKNEHEIIIGIIQWASIKTPIKMLPISAPILPNIVPIEAAMPLKELQNCTNKIEI